MDLYDVRSQLKALELMPRECSVLMDFFCKEEGVEENDKAIYDFRKGTKAMAPTVHSGTGGVIMEREGYETREIGFCTIAPERLIEDQNLKGRLFGEAVLGAMTPEQREKKILARDLTEMEQKNVQGVVFVTQKYCEPYDYLYAVYKKELDLRGISSVKIALDHSEDPGKALLLLETFADTLKGGN